MGDAPSKPRRRWFQFSLRSLLVLVTLAVLLLVAWRIYIEPYRGQKETAEVVKKLGGTYTAKPGPKWMFSLLGEDANNLVFINLADCDKPREYTSHVNHLPRLETLFVGGPHFTDEHLRRLHWLPALRKLVLDSAAVTDAGVAELQQALPEVIIHRSQRRALAALGRLISSRTVRPAKVDPRLQPLLQKEDLEELTAVILRPGATYTTRRITVDPLIYLTTLPTLKWLELGGPRMDDRLRQVSGMTQLEHLDLGNTDVGDVGLAHLRGLMNLQFLYLCNTNVTDDGLAHLTSLRALRWLYLCDTQVGDTGLARLATLPNLRTLDLASTAVSDAGLVSLSGQSQLQSLDLTPTKIGNAGLSHLKDQKNLQRLVLTGTRVTDAGMPHLAELRQLQTLDLSYTGISDAGLAHLKALSRLEWLDLEGTRITDFAQNDSAR